VRLSSIALRSVLAVIVLAALPAATGCGGGGAPASNQNVTTTTNPVTATLTASPSSIQAGQSTTLTWTTTNADTVTIDAIGPVTATGSQVVRPAQATKYILTASGKGGSQQAVATVMVTALGTPPPPPPPKLNGVPRSSHVVLVIEENHMFTEVYPSGMPWLSSTASTYAFATNYHADTPGSALDYYWLSSGSGELAFGCGGWGCPQPITSDNIFRELSAAGISWKLYAEGLPNVGYIGGDTGAYVERHNPAKWYSDIVNSPSLQQNIVPFTQFTADLAANQLPAYSIVIPDVNHDAHDGTVGQADAWLQTNVAPLLNSPSFSAGGNGLLIVTFDECDGAVGACPEQVFTAVIGPNVKRGFQSNAPYKHENTLRTILDALGVTVYPGAASTAADMADFFQ
jgi:phosphatidylinositol-3-phosphatase